MPHQMNQRLANRIKSLKKQNSQYQQLKLPFPPESDEEAYKKFQAHFRHKGPVPRGFRQGP